jgi:hypothetical protein
MLKSSNRVIISEPIKNLSNNKYLGFFAKKSANAGNAGNGEEIFRFSEESFIKILENYKDKLLFSYEIIKKDRDILVVIKCL